MKKLNNNMRDKNGRFIKGSSGWHHSEEAILKMKPTQFKKGHAVNLGRKMPEVGVTKAVESRRLHDGYSSMVNKTKERMTGKTYEEIYGKEKAEETRRKIGLKSLNRTPANKGKTYEEFYGKEKSKFLKEIIKENRKKQIFPMRDTKIEVKIQNYLKELKVEFFTHYYCEEILHAYRCDVFIPVQEGIVQKTIIECDGDYWHGNSLKYSNLNNWQKEQIKKDKIRTQELKEKGFRVIRLWENKIKEMNLNGLKEVLFL